jgi:coenzyme F420-reducing hydrogenase gamma subunit
MEDDVLGSGRQPAGQTDDRVYRGSARPGTAELAKDVDANFEVVFWPLAMDAKVKDVEAMPDKSIFLTLFNGSMRNADNVHMAKLMHQKSQILVSFGSCAWSATTGPF